MSKNVGASDSDPKVNAVFMAIGQVIDAIDHHDRQRLEGPLPSVVIALALRKALGVTVQITLSESPDELAAEHNRRTFLKMLDELRAYVETVQVELDSKPTLMH